MEPKSILEGITEHDVVTVHNPLSTVFIGKAARSVTAPPNRQANPTGNSTADAFLRGIANGIDNGGHTSMAHVQQEIPFQPGQTLRLPGDVARVIVNQLVRQMMQLDGATRRISDPVSFMEYEKRVVLDHASMLSNLSVETVEQRLQRQLDDLNPTPETKETENERAFPTVTGSTKSDTAEAKPTTGSTKSAGKPEATTSKG